MSGKQAPEHEIDLRFAGVLESARRLTVLRDGADASLLAKELAVTLEELEVAVEELRQQNEELTSAQTALSAGRHRYRELFALAPLGYLETDQYGTIQEANHAAVALLGFSAEQLVGRPLAVFVAQDHRRTFRQRLSVASEGQAVHGLEVRIEPRHRRSFFAVLDVVPVADETRATTLLWALTDVTEAKLEEVVLRDREARLRLLVSQIPAVVWTTDTELRLTSLEGSALTALGLDADELVGLRIDDHLRLQDGESPILGAHREALAGRPASCEFAWLDHILSGYVERLLGAGDVVEGCIGVAYDVTESRLVRLALEEALESERKASEQLTRINDVKDLMMAAISHDLGNRLSAILGLALTLDRLPVVDSEDGRTLIRRIAENARDMDRMRRDLLDLDRLDMQILEPQRSEVDVAVIAARVTAGLALDPSPFTIEPASLLADVDEAKVERVIENLLTDAVNHTPAGTPIWVRLSRYGSTGALVTVEDAGPGVPDEMKDKIFHPYSGGGGEFRYGLGLAIVAGFAELHGGRAWVEDRPGGGASFKVELPGTEPPT